MSAVDISRKEKYSRSVALEEDYVHQVYEKIGKDLAHAKDPLEVTVRKFLENLEPGSLVADIGCGDGRHLRNKDGILSMGADNSCLQATLARQRCQEALLSDNLKLPFRGNVFDAVLSVGVIHHFTTKERRIEALKELSRILKIGGRVLIAVQRNNTQNSQDVLIPWFDVPKDKKLKDKRLFEQDSGEYELEDDKDDDDDDDDDSISLPSSDECDTPWTNYAKLFPPKSHAKQGWNSDRQSRSLDYDYQTSSNHVPNTKQLIQNNTCYAFVKKALKRFSSVDTSEEDPCFTPDLYHRVDSAVPPSPPCGQEQKLNVLNNSSFNLDETLQKTISDNFIELLNIDDEQDTSSFASKRDCTCESLSNPILKDEVSNKTKGTLIRSLSDMFKNMNSLWSSKGTKSCSDLKSHATARVNSFDEEIDSKNRLVRSKTTATCNTEFDYLHCLEDIEELDMTVTEANQIVNEFLEISELSAGKTDSECVSDKNIHTSLTHSDIVNGNVLHFNGSSSACLSSNFKKYDKENKYSNPYAFAEEKVNRSKPKCGSTLQNEMFYKPESFRFVENTILPHESKYGDFFWEEKTSKLEKVNSMLTTEYAYKSSFENLEIESLKAEKSYISDDFLEKYSFLFDDTLDSYELSKLNRTSSSDKNAIKQQQFEAFDIRQRNKKESLTVDNKYNYSEKKSNSHLSETSDSNTDLENQTVNSSNQNNTYLCTKVTDHSNFNEKSNEKITVIETVCGVKQTFPSNISPIHYKCLIHNSPKKLQKMNQNPQLAGSKTLGPFYDEDDDDDYFFDDEDPALSSYYSMPELHALPEFYQEYTVYQNYLVNNTTIEFPAFHDKYLSKKEETYLENNHSKNNLKLENQDLASDNNSQLSTDNHICGESLESKFYDESPKTDLCNSIQTVSDTPHVSVSENETGSLNPPKTDFLKNENESSLAMSPISPKRIPLLRLNEEKYRLLISPKRKQKINQKHGTSSGVSLKISRSHSIGSLSESRNNKIINKNFALSELSSSHPTLLSFSGNGSKSNLITNKLKSNRNLYDSDCTLADDISVDKRYLNQKVLDLEKYIQNKQNFRAFKRTNEDCNNSVPKISGVSKDFSCNFSVDIVQTLNESIEINPTANRLDSFSNDTFSSKYHLPIDSKDSRTDGKCFQTKSTESHFMKHIKINPDSESSGITKGSDLNLKEDKLFFELTKSVEQRKGNGHLLDSVQFMEDSYLEKCAAESYPEIDTLEFLNKKSKEGFSEKEDPLKSSPKAMAVSGLKSGKHSNTDISPEYLTDPVTHFSFSNISKTEPDSSFHQLEITRSENDSQNGAKSDIKLPTHECVRNNDTSAAFTNSNTESVRNVVASDAQESNHFDSFQTIPQSDHVHFTNIVDSCDENINYAYGKIHEEGASVVSHRYHHLFEEEELNDLIENNISDLHVLSSFREESHWCIVAEKVRVWTI